MSVDRRGDSAGDIGNAERRGGGPAPLPAGFSLLELMIAIAVLGALLAVGVPSFAALVRETQLSTSTNDFLSGLFLTRSEAIKRRARVTICTSPDGVWCAANVGWHRGWIVFEDGNGNGRRDVGETLLAVSEQSRRGARITGNDPVRDYVSYVGSGTTRRVGGALQMGTIRSCFGGVGRLIVISSTGRPRVEGATVCPDG